MSQAAYKTTIKLGGTVTAIVGEATTDLGSDQFQITDPIKQVLDPDTAVIVYDDATPVVPADIDYLFGIVTLPATPSGTVTIDASYVPLGTMGGSFEYSLDIGGDILDDTNFAETNTNNGFRTKTYGLLDVSTSVSRYDDLAKTFKNHKRNREKVFIEIRPGGGNDIARGWFVIETDSSSGDIGSLEQEALQFNLSDNGGKSFSFRTVS